MSDDKTIYALASAAGRAGVAVFRISGKDAQSAIALLCKPNTIPASRYGTLRTLHNAQSGEAIDKILLLYFAAPNSFTGEDVVEFHTHGGRAVIDAVTQALQRMTDFRLAEAGEFTRRAFENGKMDLTEAEAIADLVHAETEAQRKQALRQLDGALGALYEKWRTTLSRSLAYMEAAIDFADEELPNDLIEKQSAALRTLRTEIATHLNDNRRGERLRDGFSIAILGAPNAGKSSLLNALARREAAIVSPIAGTTRDVIEVHLDIGGYPVTLADTAGLRKSNDTIESEGIRRALSRAEQADLKLLVLDATTTEIDATLHALIDADTIVVLNKTDIVTEISSHNSSGVLSPSVGRARVGVLPSGNSLADIARGLASPTPSLSLPTRGRGPLSAATHISAKTGAGITDLLQKIAHEIETRFNAGDAPPLTRARHRTALEECVEHLDRALTVTQPDMRAEDVRMAMRALGRITGRVDVEDLLDIIFRDFCIGK